MARMYTEITWEDLAVQTIVRAVMKHGVEEPDGSPPSPPQVFEGKVTRLSETEFDLETKPEENGHQAEGEHIQKTDVDTLWRFAGEAEEEPVPEKPRSASSWLRTVMGIVLLLALLGVVVSIIGTTYDAGRLAGLKAAASKGAVTEPPHTIVNLDKATEACVKEAQGRLTQGECYFLIRE